MNIAYGLYVSTRPTAVFHKSELHASTQLSRRLFGRIHQKSLQLRAPFADLATLAQPTHAIGIALAGVALAQRTRSRSVERQ